MCDVLLPPGVNAIAVKYIYIAYSSIRLKTTNTNPATPNVINYTQAISMSLPSKLLLSYEREGE
jgi:hypothetical protein